MAGFLCPYCNQYMSISNSTHTTFKPSFYDSNSSYGDKHGQTMIEFYRCPNCDEYTIISTVLYDGSGRVVLIRPTSTAKQFPDYIPAQIRNDYEDACAILNLSPKASATLSRRCLQGMIRDFWGITRKNLNQEISALKDIIDPTLWQVLDNVRQIGNIGAHMESDVNLIIDIDPNEAQSLISLIELLMKEWYINREERNRLFESIINTNAAKQAQRQSE